MSGVGGIGGIGGLGALGANIGLGAISTGGLNGPVGDVNAAAMSAISGNRMDQLIKLVEGFSSAEILLALMMAGASGHHKQHDCGTDSAMGFLLGLALASQLGQNSHSLPASAQGVGGLTATSGGQINLMA